MTIKPVLYSFRRCPYAMRARLALLASKTVCEIREVKLSAKPTNMIAVSPKATVPVLVLPDGHVIDESLDIMRWALGRNDPGCWLHGEDGDLIAANDGSFKRNLDRYKYPNRHGADAAEDRNAGLLYLRLLEARLASKPYLGGTAMGLSDAAIMPFVRQFAETDRSWSDALPLPALQTWLAQHLSSVLFDDAMVRLVPWTSEDAPILFGAR